MDYPNLKAAIAKGSIDMDALKNHSERLHRLVSEIMPDGKFPSGKSWPQDIAMDLEYFLEKEDERAVARMQADDQRRLDEEIKRVNDLNAARARLEEWVKAGGLLNSPHNFNAIDTFIRTAPELGGAKGKFSVGTVDVALAYLGPKGSNVLQWAPAPVAAPVVEASAPVEFLPDGSERLAIGTKPQYWHTKEQLRDLDRRTRESLGLNKDRQGWRGAGSIA